MRIFQSLRGFMAKVNFKKAEEAIDNTARKILIANLSDLATIATAIQEPGKKNFQKQIDAVIIHFRKELKKLKKHDPVLYKKLNLSIQDEKRFNRPPIEYTPDDWQKLKTLKEKIDELKSELYGEDVFDQEYEKQILNERRKHINKRFNVKEGWLPLH